MKKLTASFLIIVSVGVIVFIASIFVVRRLDFIEHKSDDSVITLFAVGDIMLDRDVELMIKEKGNGDFRFPFLKIANYLKKADILFGNLESVISDKKGEKFKKTGSVRVYFKAKPEALEGLFFAGFDVISVANNHALDYGREVFEDNLKRLEQSGIEYIGGGLDEEETFSVKIQEVKGTKIGFLGYTYPRYDGQYIPWRPTEDK